MHERLIADTAARGDVYAPDYVIDYAEKTVLARLFYSRGATSRLTAAV
jgi:hypothetical protein